MAKSKKAIEASESLLKEFNGVFLSKEDLLSLNLLDNKISSLKKDSSILFLEKKLYDIQFQEKVSSKNKTLANLVSDRNILLQVLSDKYGISWEDCCYDDDTGKIVSIK